MPITRIISSTRNAWNGFGCDANKSDQPKCYVYAKSQHQRFARPSDEVVPVLFAPPQTRPSALSVPNISVSLNTIPPTTTSAEGHVPDEVSSLRQMFRAHPNLSRASFALGDTLGTGTFGRVESCVIPAAATREFPTSYPSSYPRTSRLAATSIFCSEDAQKE